MRRVWIFAAAVQLAAADRDPGEVLSRAVAKVLENNRHIPNYTCVETVSRVHFHPLADQLPRACPVIVEMHKHPTPDFTLRRFLIDRLRLDVAMTDKGEIFSWAGATKFDDRFVDRVARNGPMATGLFGALLLVLFGGDVKSFRFTGTPTVNGRTRFEYAFDVPKAESHYKVKMGDDWVYTAYSGTIQVDPETSDLVQIHQQSAALPEATHECLSVYHVELGHTAIGSREFLLPTRALQTFVAPNGIEVENTTEFANCREYRGESTVLFDGDPVPAVAKTPSDGHAAETMALGAHFAFELTAPISSETAAAGDTFHGRLIEAIRNPKGKVVAARGTAVEGRLLRVQIFHRPPVFLVVLRPETIEIKGSKVPVIAMPDWSRARVQSSKDQKRLVFDLPQPGEERASEFRFPRERALIPKGFQSYWRVAPPFESHRSIGN